MNLAVLAFSVLLQSRINQQIVVTASDTPETVESTPASVTVVTKKDIDDRAARDVADVLREVPGLTLARSGSFGKQTSLFTRGAASTQTLVLWNGVPVNNPYFSGFDWGRFSTAGVERVEVVRGPFSALYGSEAMAGVINVVTTPQKSRFRGEMQAGGHGLRNELIDGAWAGDAFSLSGAAEHRNDDGFNANDDFRQNSGNLFGRWSPASSFSIGLGARHTSYDFGIPFNTNADATALVPSLHRRQDGHETQILLPVTFRFLDLTLSQNKRRDNFEDPEDPFTTSTSTDAKSQRGRLTVRRGSIVAGAEYERQTVSDVTNFGPNFLDRKRTGRALFIEDRVSHALRDSRLELSLGLRYDRFDAFGSQTSPRLAAALISDGTKWRIAYGQGFRAPSLGELYYPFFGNANLHAESNRSFEFGYDAPAGRGGLFSITYFNNRFRNLITFDPTTFISANIGRARTEGLEVGLEQPLSPSLYTAISYTYLHRAEDEATHERLTRRPKHAGSLFLGWRNGNIDTSIDVRRTGSREDFEAVLPFGRVIDAAYTTIDLNLQWSAAAHGGVMPFVKIENLRDTRYEEVRGYAAPRRRAVLGLRFGS